MDIATPCYLFDLDRLSKNLEKVLFLRQQTGCKVLLALKGFSSVGIIPNILKYIDGLSASGAYEAQLGKEFKTTVSTYAPAYPTESFSVVTKNSDIIVFNSEKQYRDLSIAAHESGVSCGIRINPDYSELPESFGANPCRKYSHLGISKTQMPALELFGNHKIEGIHLHTMCGQNSDTLSRTISHIIDKYDLYLKQVNWINLGGGQLYGADEYNINLAVESINTLKNRYQCQVFIEPCEGLLTQCSYLATQVLDIVHNEVDIAILDSSAICHLSDAVYRGWERDIVGAGSHGDFAYNYRIAGCSCYAGDIFGDYSFKSPLHPGDKVFFQDAGIYSLVKACMFNGIPFPKTATFSKKDGFRLLSECTYQLFRQTL